MNFQELITQNGWILKIIYSVIAIIVVVIMYKLISNIIDKAVESNRFFNIKKTSTYIKFIKSINRYIFIIIALLMLLKIYGVDISSILAGIGIIGVVIGLAIQDFLKDIIRGVSILSDSYFSVGDIIKYKDIEGKVLVIGLKTTKIQDLATDNIYSISNRNIEEVAVISKYIYVRVPLPYELKLKQQHKVIDDILEIIKDDQLVEDCKNVGLTELADSKIEYMIRITLNPINKKQVRRNALEHIIEGLEKNNIEVPYNQIDVHQK